MHYFFSPPSNFLFLVVHPYHWRIRLHRAFNYGCCTVVEIQAYSNALEPGLVSADADVGLGATVRARGSAGRVAGVGAITGKSLS